ncbi:unnamed protein product [Parascedosporium putredinis]|uniref:Uncharacterized protein n=1 Tax=Parascedosporium putredinis TaxID=1442378 RepID=A0A9P1GX69_9PEZI|nr:unnamed protein product [Parascedosporium putredinis]CAI7990286.1 unnamed protein product [Parascedosporium putredinis]
MRRALNLRLACQGMAMKVSANLVVQNIAHRKSPETSPFDWQQVLEFAIYGFIGSQVGNVIQYLLEDWFPTGSSQGDQVLPATIVADRPATTDVVGEKKTDESTSSSLVGKGRTCLRLSPDLIWRNVIAKLVLDQTFGLLASGCVFLICTNIARAGWHIWPLVAMCNYLWVPVRSRVLVAVFVGFGWSIFLSIFARK